jgi:hypothetical protein
MFGGLRTIMRLGLWVSAGLLLVGSCSVQNPNPATDSVRGRSKAAGAVGVPGDASLPTPSIDHYVIRVDYLRPTESIRSPELYIYKEKHRLYVLERGVLVREYPVGLGPNTVGDKEREGDGRTPEGEFYICLKNGASKFFRSLGLSYPTRKHAERAFMAGMISPDEYRDIILALERSSRPPWDTALGGEIFIHGGGAHVDWTDGCVALYDSDMEELYQIAHIGTRVVVRP